MGLGLKMRLAGRLGGGVKKLKYKSQETTLSALEKIVKGENQKKLIAVTRVLMETELNDGVWQQSKAANELAGAYLHKIKKIIDGGGEGED